MIDSILQTFRSAMRTNLSARPMVSMLAVVLAMAAQQTWAACSVHAQAVSFGSYDVFSKLHLDGTGIIDVSCSPSIVYTISLSPGGETYVQRQMASGGAVLDYNLYTNASRTVVWGDGTGATATVSGSGTSASHTIYGRIPAGQNKPVGSYSNTITLTLTF